MPTGRSRCVCWSSSSSILAAVLAARAARGAAAHPERRPRGGSRTGSRRAVRIARRFREWMRSTLGSTATGITHRERVGDWSGRGSITRLDSVSLAEGEAAGADAVEGVDAAGAAKELFGRVAGQVRAVGRCETRCPPALGFPSTRAGRRR